MIVTPRGARRLCAALLTNAILGARDGDWESFWWIYDFDHSEPDENGIHCGWVATALSALGGPDYTRKQLIESARHQMEHEEYVELYEKYDEELEEE